MKVISRKGPALVQWVPGRLAGMGCCLVATAVLAGGLLPMLGSEPPASPRAAANHRSQPVRVQIGSLKGFKTTQGLAVQWETTLEIGALFFELEREVAGKWTPVADAGVPALNNTVGGRYRVLDQEAGSDIQPTYRVVATVNDGQRIESTPATIKSAAQLPHGETPQLAEPRPQKRPLVETPTSAARPASPIDLTTGSARVKMITQSSGIHWVTAQSLANLLSQSLATVEGWINAGQIAISNQGLPVTYIPAVGINDTLDDVANGFYFYAESHRDNYSYANVYWLQAGANAWTTVSGGNPATTTSNSYVESYRRNSDSLYINTLVTDPEADCWMMQGLFAGHPTYGTTTYTININHLVKSPILNAVLTLNLYGGSETTHSVQFTLNGTVLGTTNWTGRTPKSVPYSMLSNKLNEGNNTLVITASLLPGVTVSQVYVDSIQLDYPRTYYATSGLLEAGANSNAKVTVSGIDPTYLQAFEVTNPRIPKSLTNFKIGPGSTITHNTSSGTARYAYVQYDLGLVPVPSLSIRYPTTLSSAANRGTYTVISPASLASGAAALAAYRADRLRTKVVMLEDVYDEFNYGLQNPHAIQTFIKTAYASWASPPRYVALFGDGTYDYRNLQGAGDNLVPPLMVNTIYGLFSSDSLYGNVKDDGLPRVAIGRIPVTTLAEATAVAAKMESYESKSFPGPLKALLIADRPDSAGDFVAGINNVAGYLAPTYSSQSVYPEPYPVGGSPPPIDVASMRSQIQSALNDGVDIVNYIGHGAVDRFGELGYIALSDYLLPPVTVQPPLANSARLPIVLAMTCVAGQYSVPGYDCLAEVLLTQSDTGGIATIAPTGLSQDEDAQWINRRLMELFSRHTSGRLGDFVMQSFSLYTTLGAHTTPLWIYNLIGDPAMPVLAETP